VDPELLMWVIQCDSIWKGKQHLKPF